ncbi:MAG: SMP-30/gluconolactonase/LRE family protein [Solirubrobacterales bacterium]|nr:SMP-30/gluconolactonase/LRE family protein [Solirubrobacterales bacterium]
MSTQTQTPRKVHAAPPSPAVGAAAQASLTSARRLVSVALAACAAAALAMPAGASASFGDAKILAPFPADPGFPEGVAVHDGKVYAAGAATFGTTGAGPSSVVVYDRESGAQNARHDVVGENLLSEHANSSIAFDGDGRLYVLNTQLGVYRLKAKGQQQTYSPPFPDLKPCAPPIVNAPCSPTIADGPPLPNDIAFAPNGDAYVSDSMQATIWRIPKGGGAAKIWYQDSRFASPYIGTNGLRLNPAGTRIYLTVSTDTFGQASVYSLPLAAAPTAAQLSLFHRFGAGELPDGIAFGATGKLHVAMASPTGAGVMILNTDGTVAARLTNPQGSLVDPYDGPANIAFDGAGRILITNHAPVNGLVTKKFSIVDTDVGDDGAPLFTPMIG